MPRILLAGGHYADKLDGMGGLLPRGALGEYHKKTGLKLYWGPTPAVLDNLRGKK
jgi:hypothetical protein